MNGSTFKEGPNSGSGSVSTLNVGGEQGAIETTAVEKNGESSISTRRPGGHVYNLSDIMQRDQMIGTGSITTSHSFGSVAFDIDPWALLLGTAQTQNFTNNYEGIRGDITVTAIANLPAGCYGLYSMVAVAEAYVPVNTTPVRKLDQVDLPFTARHGPHVLFDCARSNTVQLTLPFVWPEDFMQLRGYPPGSYGTMYRVRLQALQPLKNVSNETFSGLVTMFARLEPGYQLINPKYQSGRPSDYARSLAAGLNVAGDVLDAFGYTKEAQSDPNTQSSLKLYTNPSTVDGFDTSESVSLRSAPYVEVNPGIGGASMEDPATFESLFKHWTLIQRLPWTTGALANDNLGIIPVTPCRAASIESMGGVGEYIYDIQLTPAGYVSLPFEHWRGGMEYQIIIPTSAYHRGSVQVIWSPKEALSFTTDPTGRSLNVIVDVALGSTQTIGVDYAHHSPVLDTVYTAANSALKLGTTPHSTTEVPSWHNGFLHFRVVQRLVASTNAGNAADSSILVFARAKSDMRFGVPRQYLGVIENAGIALYDTWALKSTIRYQAGATIGDYTPGNVTTQLVVSEGDPEMPARVLWGDDIRSVRALMQRLSPMFTSAVYGSLTAGGPRYERAAGDEANRLFSLIPMIPTPPSGGVGTAIEGFIAQNLVNDVATNSTTEFMKRSVFTWFSHYAMLFTGVRASLRVKINRAYGPDGTAMVSQAIFDATKVVTQYNYTNATNVADSIQLQPYLQPQPLSQLAGAEFVVPYGEPAYFLNPVVIKDANYFGGVVHGAFFTTTVASGLTATKAVVAYDSVMVGAGPDVTAVGFRRVPLVRIMNSVDL